MLVDVSKVGNVSEVGDPAAFDGHKQLMWFHPENIRKIKQLTTKGTRRSGDGLPPIYSLKKKKKSLLDLCMSPTSYVSIALQISSSELFY